MIQREKHIEEIWQTLPQMERRRGTGHQTAAVDIKLVVRCIQFLNKSLNQHRLLRR